MSIWTSKIVGHDRVAPDQLLAHPLNFRKHPIKQREALAAAIAEVGFIRSVTVNQRTGNLIDGHERVWQALTSEQPLIDVEYVDLSEEEEKKALATMDGISEMAEIDPVKLDELLREIDTGSEALQEMLADLAKDAGLYQTGEVVEDEVPEPPVDPITKPGDLWLLGEHRLLCGDSTKTEDVSCLFNGARACLLFTSPPYAQQRDYGKAKEMVQDWDGLMQGVFGQAGGIMEPDGQVLVNLGLVHRDGEWMPYWDGWIAWMREQGWRRFGWYVWDQGFGLPGDWNGRFAPSHEFVFHFNRDSRRPEKWVGKQPENIKPRNKGESTMRGKDGKTKAFTNPGASGQATKIPDSVIRVGRQVGSNGHPAQFPVGFAASMLQSWPGLAYEPFAGSGTTIIAAEQLGRRCYGLELEPKYCDVVCSRWAKLTGKMPVLEGSGKPFAEVAEVAHA